MVVFVGACGSETAGEPQDQEIGCGSVALFSTFAAQLRVVVVDKGTEVLASLLLINESKFPASVLRLSPKAQSDSGKQVIG